MRFTKMTFLITFKNEMYFNLFTEKKQIFSKLMNDILREIGETK